MAPSPSSPLPGPVGTVARVAFCAALIFACVMATLPNPPPVPGNPIDKVQHITAFATLALLAAIAYPRTPLPRLAERLSFLGALIELVQSIPALHRDCDIHDWLADTAAIVVVLALVAASRRKDGKPGDRGRRPASGR